MMPARCPGCGRVGCPNPRLECGGEGAVMPDPDPSQIEAAAEAIAQHDGEPYEVAARAALTAAAQVQPDEQVCICGNPGHTSPWMQPAPEADEREAPTTERIRDALSTVWVYGLDDTFGGDWFDLWLARRSQPAPRTVSAEVAAERDRQVAQGYTPEHDDRHGATILGEHAHRYLMRAMREGNRSDLIRAAATLVAAAECVDRLHSFAGITVEAPQQHPTD